MCHGNVTQCMDSLFVLILYREMEDQHFFLNKAELVNYL